MTRSTRLVGFICVVAMALAWVAALAIPRVGWQSTYIRGVS
jgi:hypothetical protein